MEGWFRSSKFRKGFYKFAAPCERHALYREGDSWAEEIGISYKVFKRSISAICQHYKTKTLYKASQDKFEGKLYASYVDKKTCQTYYVRNDILADEFFKNLKSPSKKDSAMSHNVKKDHCSNVQKVTPLARAHPINILHTLTSLTESPVENSHRAFEEEGGGVELSEKQAFFEQPEQPTAIALHKDDILSEEQLGLVRRMVDIFNEQTESRFKLLPSHVRTLWNALVTRFDGVIEVWDAYCRRIASSEFLMGKAKNSKFKAVLLWVIGDYALEGIKQGEYGVKGIPMRQGRDELDLDTRIELGQITHDLMMLGLEITREQDELEQAQKKNIKEYQEKITSSELQEIKKGFVPTGVPGLDKVAFDNFLWLSIKSKLGYQSYIEIPYYLKEKKDKLEARQKEIDKELAIQKHLCSGMNRKIISFFKKDIYPDEFDSKNIVAPHNLPMLQQVGGFKRF
jgi:hypothetical protein